MKTIEDRLYELLELADRQQRTVQTAIEGLAIERAAVARERAALEILRSELPAVLKHAVSGETRMALAGAVEGATSHLVRQTVALQGGFDRLQAQAEGLEQWLRRLGAWTSWRLLGRCLIGVVALMLLGGVAGNALLWWGDSSVQTMLTRQAQLKAEGLLGSFSTCGPSARPCVAVDEAAGAFGNPGNYRIIQGY